MQPIKFLLLRLRALLGLLKDRASQARLYELERENRELREQLAIARSEVAVINEELSLKTLSMERSRAVLQADLAVLQVVQATGKPLEKG